MRNFVLLVAVVLAASLSATSSHAAAKKADPAVAAQENTNNFLKAAFNPYEASAKPAKAAKKGKKK